VGIAAGIDRTGARLASLAAAGAGHVEVGTLTDVGQVEIGRAALPAGFRVGINFASARRGIDEDVIDDYCALLRRLWDQSDYLVANLSSPSGERTRDDDGVEWLIDRMARERDELCRATGVSRPILIKIGAGAHRAGLPRGIAAALSAGLDGIVLVSSCLERILEVCDGLDDTAVVSVGGVSLPGDAIARLVAGAKLVQIHSAFAVDGEAAVRRLLGKTRAAVHGGRGHSAH
jgi:dihydroorotate dehydrogenase